MSLSFESGFEEQEPTSWDELRRRFVDRLWHALAAMGLLNVPQLVMNLTADGMTPALGRFAAVTVVGLALYLVRHRLSDTTRLIIGLSIAVFVGALALFTAGVLSDGDIWLVVANVFAATILSRRASQIVAAISIALFALAATGFLSGRLVPPQSFLLHAGGAGRWLDVATVMVPLVIFLSFSLAGFQQSVRDLLDRSERQAVALRELNAAREAAQQRAERASEMKSEFLALMSHEVRTPLTGVLGMLRFSLRDESLSTDTRRHLVEASSNADALLTIINDILDLSKIEAGKLRLEMIDFEFATVARGAAAALSAIAAEKSLRLDIEFGDRAPTWVRGDPTRVRQVVQNLVGNALKFTMSGGVTVRTTGTADGHVQVEVRDTGIGIAPEALSRLFGKFEQADQSTTRRFGGTGLGLSIVKQLVDAMGGTVTVASTLGVGTTFTVTLPLDPGMPTTETALPPLARHSRRLRILCAEDYPTNQVIIRAILADLGHDAVVVDTGRAALVALAREPFDLVLMDGRMPEMDGETAVRHLRTGRWEDRTFLDPKVRVVALTANASPEDRARFLASGMDAFLTKPVAERALHAELETAIRYQLERGITLPPLGVVGAAALDALFGITDDDDSSPSAPTPFRATVAIAAVAPLEERLRAAFVATVSDRFADLVRAVERADGEAILLLSHGLKGSAGYADAPDVVSAAGAIEAAARDGDLSHVDELLPTLRNALAPFLLLGAA